MKTSRYLLPLAVILAALLLAGTGLAQSGPPPLPPDPILDSYSFLDTNWVSDYGYPPIGFSNLVWTPEWEGNALMLDTTNETEFPAFLNYNIAETNGHLNLRLDAGAVLAVVIPDWSSADTNQLGQGPGGQSYLLTAGDFSSGSPQGLWAIYVDAGGTNLYFGGVSNSVATTYVTAPISWAAGEIHEIGLTYSTNSALYLDGQFAASGGPVTVVPSTNTQTNGFFVGSDASGYEQARCVFWYLELENSNFVQFFGTNYFTGNWEWLTNGYDTWLNPVIAGFQSGFGSSSDSQLPPTPTNTVNTNFAAYTNFWLLATNTGGQAQVNLINPCLGLTYVILTNARLEPIASTNWQPWVTLVGSNTVMPTRPMRPASNTLFFCAELIPSTGTNGLPDWWSMQYFGTLNVDPYADPDGDGLCNLTEYLLGTNPTNANSVSSLHNDAQAMFLAYTNDAACRHHLAITNGPDPYTLLVTMWPTQIGTNYQIYSKDESVSSSDWCLETNFLGTDTATTVAIYPNGRTLSLIGGYGEDSDGDGLPDGYEVLATHTDPYLSDTGITGTIDAYKDPDGDGYVNIVEYQNGTDPLVFNPPVGPINVVLNPGTDPNTYDISWQAAAGAVMGYIISGYNYGSDAWVALATNSPTQLTYVLEGASQYDGGNGIGSLRINVQAIYAGGYSTPNPASTSGRPAMAQAALVHGRGGRTYLLTSAAHSNLIGCAVTISVDGLDLPREPLYYQTYQTYATTNPSPFFIPASQFTNGITVLTTNQAPPGVILSAAITPQMPGGGNWGLDNFAENQWTELFFDTATEMKQNVRFLLRAANASPFGYTMKSDDYGSYSFIYPSNYVYSSIYGVTPAGGPDYPGEPYSDHWLPLEENYFFANFVFNASIIDNYGYLDSGFVPWSFENYYRQTNKTQFEFPTYNYVASGSLAPIPGLLSSSQTPWVGYFDGDLGDFGAYTYSNMLAMSGGYANIYGLPYSSLKLTLSNNVIGFATLSPGNNVSAYNNLPFYAGTADPELQTVGYYFADAAVSPFPGYQDGSFSTASATPSLIIGSVGNHQYITGYAKQAVLNGYGDVFAYLGQYFTNAFVISNGAVTTNLTGVLSEFGEFFPTAPGQVELVTMPDPDQNNTNGVCQLDIIRLSLDVNHDGTMDETFTGPDNTSQQMPFNFWANNDYDRYVNGGEDDVQQSLSNPTPDYDYTDGSGSRAIPCPRDLEDYARLWVSGVSNTLSRLPQGSTVTLSWQNNSGATIDLFQAADADGGMGYQTNLSTASNQINNSICRYVGRIGPWSSLLLNDCSYSECWAGDHYIWCGVYPGSDQLNLTISDGTGKQLAQSSQYIQIQDIKQMYERWTVGDMSNSPSDSIPPLQPMTKAFPADDNVSPGYPTQPFIYPYYPADDTNDDYIVYVHGWNTPTWEKDRNAETMYKRLYWQGYQGRFGSFRWPCNLLNLLNLGTYDLGEWTAWQCGQPFETFLTGLNSQYPGKVYVLAHSMGNVVTGEALRLAGANPIVNTYVATQAAISARAYDNTVPADITNRYAHLSVPDSEGHYYTNGAPPYFNGIAGASHFVDYYNYNDAVLGWWVTDQQLKPDNSYYYSTSFSQHPSGYYQQFGINPYRNLLFPANTYEIFARAVPSYSRPLGAETTLANPFDPILSVNLNAAPYNFQNQHSLQFRADNMTTAVYWHQLLINFGINH